MPDKIARMGESKGRARYEDAAKGGRAYGGGPSASKKGTAKAVTKARVTFKAGQAKKAAFNKEAYKADRPSETNAARRSVRSRTAPAAAAKGKNLLEQAGDFLKSRVDLASGKTRTPISGAMGNPNVPSLVRREVKKIKKVTGK